LLFAGCVASRGASGLADGRFDRADDLDQFTPCTTTAVLDEVDDPTVDADALKAIGVHSRAAIHIADTRDGEDGLAGTADDFVFTTLQDLDDVPYVGPVAMDELLAYGDGVCAGQLDPDPAADGDCGETALLAWLDDPATTADDLKDAGVYSRAADEIIRYRDGADGQPGTADDQHFDSLDDVDAVPQVGPTSMDELLAAGEARCGATASVLMSPQAYDQSHLALTADRIDSAQTSLDVAMYSFSDTKVLSALQRALDRGVAIRLLFDGAADDRLDPAGTRSAQLEDMGIEVRWVNKIMHHKFALIDGPRDDTAAARSATLINSSGNWSYGAATQFDENTVVLHGDERLSLLYQREFDTLWDHSRPVVWNESIAPVTASLVITDDVIAASDGSDAVFTSANFRTYDSARYGWTFAKVSGRYTGSDEIVSLIGSATDSIEIASGHMRSRAIAEALVAEHAQDPSVRIRVYLDDQEYVSDWYHGTEQKDYADCRTAATTDGQLQACDDAGEYFANDLVAAGIDVRYKFYAYRWDYHYADQMHDKYLIVDGRTVASGSYNYSNNAELDTMENIAIYSADRYPQLVSDFEANFDTIWATGRAEGLYAAYMDQVQNGTGAFPIVFAPMALDFDQVTALKDAIRTACPAVSSDPYRTYPASHRRCEER